MTKRKRSIDDIRALSNHGKVVVIGPPDVVAALTGAAPTPGPWTANGNGVHVGHRCVATTHMEPQEQRQADARLIAAAPELLSALRRLLAATADTAEHDAAEIAASKAIAKAEART